MSNYTTSKPIIRTAFHDLSWEALVYQIIGHDELTAIEIPGRMPHLEPGRVERQLSQICRILESVHSVLITKNGEGLIVAPESLLRIIGYTCEFASTQLSSLSSTIDNTTRRRYAVNVLACGARICVLADIKWSPEESLWIHEKIEDMIGHWEAYAALSDVENSIIQHILLSSSSFEMENMHGDLYSTMQKTLKSSEEALSILRKLLKETQPYTMSSAREFWSLYDWTLSISGEAWRSIARIFYDYALIELRSHTDRAESYLLARYLLEELHSRCYLSSRASSGSEGYLIKPMVEQTYRMKQSADISQPEWPPYSVVFNTNGECLDDGTNDPTLVIEDTKKSSAQCSVRPGQERKSTSESPIISIVQDIPRGNDPSDFGSVVPPSVMQGTLGSPLNSPIVELPCDGPSRAMAVRKDDYTRYSSDEYISSTRTMQTAISPIDRPFSWSTSAPTPQIKNSFEGNKYHTPHDIGRKNSISGLEVVGAYVDRSTESEKIFVAVRDTESVRTSSSVNSVSSKTRNQLSRLLSRSKRTSKPPKPVLPKALQFCFSSCTQHIWFWCRKDPGSLVRLRQPFTHGQRFNIHHPRGLKNKIPERSIRYLSAARDAVVMILHLDESPWLYSLQDNAFQPLIELGNTVPPILALAVSPDGKNIALGCGTSAFVYKVSNGRLEPRLPLGTTAVSNSASIRIQRLNFSADSKRLICALQAMNESKKVVVHIKTWASAGAVFQEENPWDPVGLAEDYLGRCSVTAVSLIDAHQALLTAVSTSNPTIISDIPNVRNKVIGLADKRIESSSQCHLSPHIFAVQSGRNKILLIDTTSNSVREVVDLSTVSKSLPLLPTQVSIAVPDSETVRVIWRAMDGNAYLSICKLGNGGKWKQSTAELGSIYLGLAGLPSDYAV